MAGIEKKLRAWLEQGLISIDQFDAIGEFEQNNQNQSTGSWWLYSLLILGTSIIGLGIISLIAANWAFIPDVVKLLSAFTLLALLATAIFVHYHRTSNTHELDSHRKHESRYADFHGSYWFDALICGFIILCLATIGLISQIYHLGGQWYHALLMWSVITLPLILFARRLFTHFLWTTLFLHAAVWAGITFAAGYISDTYQQLPALFMFAPLLAAACYSFTQVTPFKHFGISFFFWFQVSGLIALVVIDIMRSGGEMREYELAWYLPGYITAGILAVIILTRPDYRALNKGLLLAVIALFLLYYHPYILFDGNTRYHYIGADAASNAASFWTADDIRAPILTIFILFLYATHAGNSGHHRTFNLITFLIGVRFVILYFQAMGGLAATGVGLIMSGLMIIGIAWFWYKSRGRLQRWSEELE